MKYILEWRYEQHMEVFIQRLQLHSKAACLLLLSAWRGDLSVQFYSFWIRPVTPGSLSTLTSATAESQQRLEQQQKQQQLLEEHGHMNNHPDAAR